METEKLQVEGSVAADKHTFSSCLIFFIFLPNNTVPSCESANVTMPSSCFIFTQEHRPHILIVYKQS